MMWSGCIEGGKKMPANIEKNDKRKYPIDRFEILGELGRGGTSIVCLVKSKESGCQYAMKTLKPDLVEAANADARADAGTGFGVVAAELLRAEAETLEELNGVLPFTPGGGKPGTSEGGSTEPSDAGHPGIPAYYGEVYRGDSFAGFLMEYVEGESLQKLLGDGRAFSVREAAEMGARLCGILARLHEMDPPRIYRDLKPGNILVKEDGSCVLVDYGAVRAYRKGASQDTHPLGTEGYAAPEQYGGWEQSDPRTDVYGVGAVLHHMLTGRTPLETGLRPLAELMAGEEAEVSGGAGRKQGETRTPGGTPQARQYSGMDKILLRACSIAPSMRYPSCRELGNALGKLCRDKTELPAGRGSRLMFGKSMDGETAWRRFVMLACASLALLVSAGVFSATAFGAEMSRYHALIRESERIGSRETQGFGETEAQWTGSRDGRLEALRQAVRIRPGDSEAYLSLLRGLSSDGILTQEEKELMEDFLYENGYPGKMREWRPEEFARLEMGLGKVYFGCYEGGTEAARRAFGNAAETAGIGTAERKAARAMCEVLGETWTADRIGAWKVLVHAAVSDASRTGDRGFAAAVCCRAAAEIALFPDRFEEAGTDPAELRDLAEEVREFARALKDGWPEAPEEIARKLETAVEAAWRVCGGE